MQGPFGFHPLADTGFGQEVGRALFQYAGSDRRLDPFALARLEHDGFDALAMQ
jgi:hypothetical protein